MSSFIYGLTLPLRALKTILAHRSLWIWSLIPFAISLALSVWLISHLQTWASVHVHSFFALHGWNPQGIWALSSELALKITIFISTVILFPAIAGIATVPFNDFLAKNTEIFTSLSLAPNPSLRETARLIAIDLYKTGTASFFSVLCIFISWVPVLNLVALILESLILTFQFISFPQTRRGLGMSDALNFLIKNLPASIGFGLSLTFLFAIPFISVFAIPLAVVGGTLLYANKSETEPFKKAAGPFIN